MKIALFPGSFKPPHSGHLKVVETIMKKYNPDKFYIIISKRPRLLVVPYELKLAQFSEKEMENIAKRQSKIRLALIRLAAGTYGVCHICGEDIPMLRLEQVPFTEKCIECKSS